MANLKTTVAVRLSEDEVKALDAMAKRSYPDIERARSMMFRKLLRQEQERLKKAGPVS